VVSSSVDPRDLPCGLTRMTMWLPCGNDRLRIRIGDQFAGPLKLQGPLRLRAGESPVEVGHREAVGARNLAHRRFKRPA